MEASIVSEVETTLPGELVIPLELDTEHWRSQFRYSLFQSSGRRYLVSLTNRWETPTGMAHYAVRVRVAK